MELPSFESLAKVISSNKILFKTFSKCILEVFKQILKPLNAQFFGNSTILILITFKVPVVPEINKHCVYCFGNIKSKIEMRLNYKSINFI